MSLKDTHPGPRAWPEKLTPELRELLGLMIFQLCPLAHGYRDIGEFVGSEGDLPSRTEDEQAFLLHRLIGIWFEHGEKWREVAMADFERVRSKLAVQLGNAE